ncbi:hypothetical protein [Actinopolymorpha alba]|uniref:hypothetical protein n=1 Tax=Actinopolymorpha alba TaxID=533267 RepID=UPI00037225A5|nr:hypothetical protein [Actinopolymorpha alba]
MTSIKEKWITSFLADWTPEHWSAAAAWVTVFVAVVATILALRQYRLTQESNRTAMLSAAQQSELTQEANRNQVKAAIENSRLTQRLAEEEARPYVIAFMESSAASRFMIDLVIRNFGKTAAYDVQLRVEPVLKRTSDGDEVEKVWLPEVIPTLVPDQEWRTFFDFGVRRMKNADLPKTYRAIVSAKDYQGCELPETISSLDWGQYEGLMSTTVYTIHDAAKSLREMEKTIKRWREGIQGGLRVYVRDGDVRDERLEREYADRQAQHDRLVERVLRDGGVSEEQDRAGDG